MAHAALVKLPCAQPKRTTSMSLEALHATSLLDPKLYVEHDGHHVDI